MLQKYTRYKILQEFFDYPTKGFRIRELSRRTGIAQPSVINHLKALLKEKLIVKEEGDLYPVYKANRDNEYFKLLKKDNLLIRLHTSNLINEIYDKTLPSAIVLFGSAARGEDTENSDIDLFIQGPATSLNVDIYEKKLKRKISFFFEENFEKLPPELKNNIINGIVLKGYLKVF
ncbi:MAG: ArsR family transcriptional regulator [Candidatus Nanohaloarchaeota archaeon]|nr:ArsR family transcriptional regulator [Candidatus Nanohaloarchaeota archaeon]